MVLGEHSAIIIMASFWKSVRSAVGLGKPGKRRILVIGTLKFFNNVRGWGYIIAGDGRELFFHHTDIRDKNQRRGLKNKIGAKLHFDETPGPKGPKAILVGLEVQL
jgi:CspA family cold shock protein